MSNMSNQLSDRLSDAVSQHVTLTLACLTVADELKQGISALIRESFLRGYESKIEVERQTVKKHAETYVAVKIGEAHPYFMLRPNQGTLDLFLKESKAAEAAEQNGARDWNVVKVEVREL